jgi:hypothetical protein
MLIKPHQKCGFTLFGVAAPSALVGDGSLLSIIKLILYINFLVLK